MIDFIDKDFIPNVHRDAVRILEEVGVKCSSQRVRTLFEETGLAAFDEELGHLHILEPLVDQTLATAPKRDKFFIPENSFGVGGTAPFVYDDKTGDLIAPTFDHIVRIAKIVNEADVVKFMARGVLVPKQESKVMETIIAHCDKPVYAAASTEESIETAHKIHSTRGDLTIQFSIVNSPLNVIESMLDSFFLCVGKGIPTYVSTMPMAGLSAPYSMSGLLALTHAEALFGIALTQLINPGVIVVHAGLPSIANIGNNYAVDLGLMSHNLANLLMEKVNKQFDIPSIQTACTTSEADPTPKAEQDAAKGYALMKRYGFHQMRHSFGFLKELISFSIAKLEKCIEVCRETGPYDLPIEKIPYDPEGVEAAIRNGGNANYMRDDHTLKHMSTSFLN